MTQKSKFYPQDNKKKKDDSSAIIQTQKSYYEVTHPGCFWSFFHPSEPTPTAGFLENPTNPFSDSVFGSGFVELGGVILLKA